MLREEKDSAEFSLVARTTDLLIAIDDENYDAVKNLLDKNPERADFLPSMILIPGYLFPYGSRYHANVSASPLGKPS